MSRTSLLARLAALTLCALLAAAPSALAANVGNANDPTGTLLVDGVTTGDASNALTITFSAATATAPAGYTVHDSASTITPFNCTDCTATDANTEFVPATHGAVVHTGVGASSVAIIGQEAGADGT